MSILLAALVAAVFGAACSQTGQLPLATSTAGVCPVPGESAAQRFRRSAGLDASREAVERAAAASNGFDRYGVPLTTSELKEMDRRQAISAATNPLRQLVHDHPDQYGQLWIDQLKGGITVVQIAPKGDKKNIEALMARRQINPKFVRFERVKRSMAELLAVTDDFFHNDVPRLKARGIEVQSAGPDLPNDVRVEVSDITPSLKRQLEKEYPGIHFGSRCS